jgi:hypothetical protein
MVPGIRAERVLRTDVQIDASVLPDIVVSFSGPGGLILQVVSQQAKRAGVVRAMFSEFEVDPIIKTTIPLNQAIGARLRWAFRTTWPGSTVIPAPWPPSATDGEALKILI